MERRESAERTESTESTEMAGDGRTRIDGRRLRRDLRDLGVDGRAPLIVHSSLSAIGRVTGGPGTVVRALVDVLGPEGTLAMPAATPQCAVPASWTGRQVPRHLPPFEAESTPTTLGVIPETFRTWPGTLRSSHPVESVCARGPLAGEVTADHPPAFSEGPGTPFGRLLELEARILLLGVGFNRCTALHLAETLSENRRTATVRLPFEQDGRRTWEEVPNVADDNDRHFPIIGRLFLAAGHAAQGKVGEAPSTLFPMKDLVSFAKEYFERELAP